MEFTFGIITDGKNDDRLSKIINSIEYQNISDNKYEIIIVGNSAINRHNVNLVKFDEIYANKCYYPNEHKDECPCGAWITKKKNMIVQKAKFENIVFMHDYFIFLEGWYDGYLKFGNDFEVCMDKTINYDNSRFRDWILWHEDIKNVIPINMYNEMMRNREMTLPYDITHLSKYMYIAGSYWVAKKHVMEEFPQDEEQFWGAGMDVDWSKKVRQKYNFSINSNSVVKIIKKKYSAWKLIRDEYADYLRNNVK